MTALFSPLVEKAHRVAAQWHGSQTRKQSDVPYITHPASVALILQRAGFDDDAVLAAALLHDVIEDTDYTSEQLAADFPPEVAGYVAALSERKRDEHGRKREWLSRKTEHIAVIAAAPLAVRAITLADKLHNLATMLYDRDRGEPVWDRFNAEPEQVLWYHRSMIAAAEQQDRELSQLAAECRDLLARLAHSTA